MAGCVRRIALRRARNGMSESGRSQSRCLSSYFSEWRYSSLSGDAGWFSNSSNPEYTPQLGDIVAASIARIANAAGGPSRSGPARMSGVFGHRFGRK